jgi:hypothetical protein
MNSKSSAWLSIKEYLNSTKKDEVNTLCLVLGAGIHQLPKNIKNIREYEALRTLSSWDNLLDSVCDKRIEAPTLSLQWEFELLDSETWSPDKTAWKRDQLLKRKIKDNISDSESIILSNENMTDGYKPLINVLLSGKVTDLIILNFDTIVEELLKLHGFVDESQFSGLDSLHNYNVYSKKDCDAQKIRIWYPNGCITNVNSITLGFMHYANLMEYLRERRTKIKICEKSVGSKNFKTDVILNPRSWLEIFMFRPILFAGTSIDVSDWTQWMALLMRWRNYAKKANSGFEPPLWRLSAGKDGWHLPKNKFKILEADNYEMSWNFLADIITNKNV